MSENRLTLLKQIMELQFTLIELNLFLDTHPTCRRALESFKINKDRLLQLSQVYEDNYGPLTIFSDTASNNYWNWIEEPWPWEINY